MSEQHPPSPIEQVTESKPEQRQYQTVNDTLLSYIQRADLRGTDYTEDMPPGDTPAKKYVISVPDQAKELFLVPEEIRRKNPKNFTITYITPHRFDESEKPYEEIRFSYNYDFDKSADYILYTTETGDTGARWTGQYMHESSKDFDVGEEGRALTRHDLNVLNTVTAATIQLNT